MTYIPPMPWCLACRLGQGKSDGEPAITSIVDRLMAEIKKTSVQARVQAEETPRHRSQSLGAVGSMQEMLQNQVRTLKTDLETKIKSHLLTSMAVSPWLVRHSAWLVERYQMKANGRTCYQDCFGTVHTGIVLRFGEKQSFVIRLERKLDEIVRPASS